jgi:hypothetical protein
MEELMKITIEQTKELERLRDEIPDPICCKKCKEFKTEKNVDHFEEMYEKSLNGTEDFTKENLVGALFMMNYISSYMENIHLYKKQVFCRKTLVNTLEKITDYLMGHYRHFDEIQQIIKLHDESLEEPRENKVAFSIIAYDSIGKL